MKSVRARVLLHIVTWTLTTFACLAFAIWAGWMTWPVNCVPVMSLPSLAP